jgi:hypothetical protein
MKKLLIGLLAIGSISSFASTIKCTKKTILRTYKATVSLEEGKASVFITSSNNRSTRNGIQSESPVAFQKFSGITSQQTSGYANFLELEEPIRDENGDAELNYISYYQTGTKSNLVVKGPSIPGMIKKLKFRRCN